MIPFFDCVVIEVKLTSMELFSVRCIGHQIFFEFVELECTTAIFIALIKNFMHVFDILFRDFGLIKIIRLIWGFEPVSEDAPLLILFTLAFWLLHIKLWVFKGATCDVDNSIHFCSQGVIDKIFLFLCHVRRFNPQLSCTNASTLQSHFGYVIPWFNVWRYLSIFYNAQIRTIIFSDLYRLSNRIILLFLKVPNASLCYRFPDGRHHVNLLPDSKIFVW